MGLKVLELMRLKNWYFKFVNISRKIVGKIKGLDDERFCKNIIDWICCVLFKLKNELNMIKSSSYFLSWF